MIQWPAIIKYHNDHELIYVEDQASWVSICKVHSDSFDALDELIDSSGMVHKLVQLDVTSDAISQDKMGLEDVTQLVRLHASELGNCCVSKLMFSSVRLAIEGVGSIKDEF